MGHLYELNVLVPYKITLLSNNPFHWYCFPDVLVPYKITLLSNAPNAAILVSLVLVPYKITLLSNVLLIVAEDERF